ncbi:MAG: M23 family metallopeptidase [Oscillospiraceae bacterium]|nr:M23 family metallopeptidase [Oscillospiraceae bacterium]
MKKKRILKATLALVIILTAIFSMIPSAAAATGSMPYTGSFRVSQAYSSGHTGLDLVGISSKNIVSITSGTVNAVGWENPNNQSQGFGLRVWVKYGNDYIVYGHLSSTSVSVGQTVSVGTQIGVEGSTGYSTGSHLHLEIRVGSRTSTNRPNAAEYIGIDNVYNTIVDPSGGGTTTNSLSYQVSPTSSTGYYSNVTTASDYAGVLGNAVDKVYISISNANVWYSVKLKTGTILPEVLNRTDYAGIENSEICGLAVRATVPIKYRVHLKGGNWLPWVTGCDWTDANNGYAGSGTSTIDAIQVNLL